MKHKHAELIKAWADGADIEQRDEYDMGGFCDWFFTLNPSWNNKNSEFRIRQYPKPDVRQYLIVSQSDFCETSWREANLKLIFDGETGELKSAEVIK